MSIQFFYEDGQGNAVDEYGRSEPTDYVVDEEQYALETTSSYTQYLCNRTRESDGRSDAMQTDDVKEDVDVRMREASIKRVYTLYTDQDKYEVNPDSIFAKRKKNGRPRILGEEHKKVILEYVDENPSVVLEQLMERLLQRFKGLKASKSPVDRNSGANIQERLDWIRKWEGTDMDFRTICVFLNESAFHVNMKRSRFLEKETLTTRINEACNRISLSDFEGYSLTGGARHGFVTILDSVMLSFASPPNASAKRDFIFRKYSIPDCRRLRTET
ncbi:hypothetical protein VTP01DRAFT_4102 [Rhizomucor pusillus]|uniref:uncharacterized protein n=1 Tax=Rhizomucor pusillus TaxID=4840 RepID=UPI0037421AFE